MTRACKHLSLSGPAAVPAGCDEQFSLSTGIDWGCETGHETHARTANRATPATQPITMPAIWPPDSPLSLLSAGGGGGGALPDSTAACSWACSNSTCARMDRKPFHCSSRLSKMVRLLQKAVCCADATCPGADGQSRRAQGPASLLLVLCLHYPDSTQQVARATHVEVVGAGVR
jgi:hypothetical protein